MKASALPGDRRYFVEGGTYLFTAVTANHTPIFHDDGARYFLGCAMRQERERRPLETLAIVLLPNHLHALLSLPSGDHEYVQRWQAIKDHFSSPWLEFGGKEAVFQRDTTSSAPVACDRMRRC